MIAVLACAGAAMATEEVVVYGDPFERWDDTRWWVVIEQVVPAGVVLGIDEPRSFRTRAWQASALLHCRVDPRDGGASAHPSCQIEDLSLRVSTDDLWQREQDRLFVDAILRTLEDELGGSKIELRADKRGGVHSASVQDDGGQVAITSHQVSQQLTKGFNLTLPDGGVIPGQSWTAYSDPLLVLPDTLITRANTLVMHRADTYAGHTLVQTIGKATTSVVYDKDRNQFDWTVDDSLSRHFGVDSGLLSQVAEKEVPCTLQLDGVSVLDTSRGALMERVWSVQELGRRGGYQYAGHLRELEAAEQVELAPSAQIAPPHQARKGLELWTPIDPAVQGEEP